MMLVIGVLSIFAHSLTIETGIGLMSKNLVLDDVRNFSTSSLDSGVKKKKIFLIGLVLMTGMGDYDWKPDLIL